MVIRKTWYELMRIKVMKGKGEGIHVDRWSKNKYQQRESYIEKKMDRRISYGPRIVPVT